MKFSLIHESYQQQLIDALEHCYTLWREVDRQQAEEERARGLIRCYSQLHLMFENPLAEVRTAEQVSFTDGIIGPPTGDARFFLLRISPERRAWLTRIFEQAGFESLIESLATTREIILPEAHSFTDACGDQYEIVGWDQADARRRIEEERCVIKPVTWSGSWVAFPCRGAIWRGQSQDEEIKEADPSEPVDEVQAANISKNDFPF